MRVLVACEFSGVVRDAFLDAGHEAISCDLLPSESKRGPHIQADVLAYLDLLEKHGTTWFDLMIAHPPCRYLARCGARWWKEPGFDVAQESALAFVRALFDLKIHRIALENPPGRIGTAIRAADQYIQPWQFGHGETKKTGLWLKNLPPLVPTDIVEGREARVHREAPGPDRWKRRSRFYPGIARAMAEQWGDL